tara:strand:+ start:23248 stop:23910 length:663 start_codon:yes stop_codon:yes gene_type:complete
MFFGAIVAIFLRPFHPIHMYYMSKVWGPISGFILGVKFQKLNFNLLNSKRACVYVMNHQSNMDIVIAAQINLKNTVTLGKKEILYFPIFGQWYWLSGNVLIKREKKSSIIRSMLRVNKTITKKNRSIVIMPEGTRSKGKGLGQFKTGAFRTAISTGVPIVPIIASDWYGNINLNKLQSGEIKIKILPEFSTKELETSQAVELSKKVHAAMSEELMALNKS